MGKHPTINGQQISWGMVRKVNKMLGGDWDSTIDAFWKARNARGYNGIIRYVMRGFVPDEKGIRYSMLPSNERENGQMEAIRDWWKSTYQTVTKEKSLGQILREIAANQP